MLLQKCFDFGQIILDTARLILFIDRGDGKEILQFCSISARDRETLLQWIQSNPEIDKDDMSQLVWQFRCFECNNQDMKQPMQILKMQSPCDGNNIILEVLGSDRAYKLQRVKHHGSFLINPAGLVYPIGAEKKWFMWREDQGWTVVHPFDEVDQYVVDQVVSQRLEKMFSLVSC